MVFMDEYQFRALHHRSKEIKELKPSKDSLKNTPIYFDGKRRIPDHTVKPESRNHHKIFGDRWKNEFTTTTGQEYSG